MIILSSSSSSSCGYLQDVAAIIEEVADWWCLSDVGTERVELFSLDLTPSSLL